MQRFIWLHPEYFVCEIFVLILSLSELHNSSILSTMPKILSSVFWIMLIVLPLSLLFQFLTFSFPVFPKFGFSLVIPFPLSNLEEVSSFHSTVHIFTIGFIPLFKVHVHIHNSILKSFFCALVILGFSGLLLGLLGSSGIILY